jgi:hypothetical protein
MIKRKERKKIYKILKNKKEKKVRKCAKKKLSLIIGNTMLLSLVSIMQNNDIILMRTVPTVVTRRVSRL